MSKKKKGRRSKPVVVKKPSDMIIRIKTSDIKVRCKIAIPCVKRFHTRSHDVIKGRRRKPKHVNKYDQY